MILNFFFKLVKIKSDILIEKHYRGMLGRSICDYFWDEVTKARGSEIAPILSTPKNFLIHIKTEGLYFVGVASHEISPLLILEFLHRITEIFEQYFEKTTEQSLRSNFVIVYQVKKNSNHFVHLHLNFFVL